ncbi:MAG: glycosyltransferase [Rhodospirillales bacterium]|nr:MAG: glycosyltransferase [Rhodospirillales bacterium]
MPDAGSCVQALHFSTHDQRGGAAIAAHRIHQGLRSLGVASRMVVAKRSGNDPDVAAVQGPPGPLPVRFWRRLDRERLDRGLRAYARTQSPIRGLFTDDRVPGPDRLSETLPAAEVYHAHWVAGLLDYRRLFARLPAGTPFVWTLHDMNPFTGGCHYALGCERYLERCGACPQLGSRNENDITGRGHRRKTSALRRLLPETTRIVAPSRWLAGDARRSALLARFETLTIPNPLDTDIFQPRDRATAREVFGLPQTARIVLFVADSLSDHRKGMDLLQSAVAGLPAEAGVTLAAVGGSKGGMDGECIALGRIDNPRIFSFALSAADVFVLPTRADNLPNVILEAMACGVPVVSFDVGGVPDMVRPGVTGLLAPPEDVAALRQAILTLLEDDALRAHMTAECRRVAVTEYAMEIAARRYLAVYEELMEASARLRPAPSRHSGA